MAFRLPNIPDYPIIGDDYMDLIASALGLKDGSFVQSVRSHDSIARLSLVDRILYPEETPAKRANLTLPQLLVKMNSPSINRHQRNIRLCTFTSLYLPDLIRAVRLNAVDQFGNPWLDTLRYVLHVADFSRYCRTHPEAPLLFDYLLKHISANITDDPQAWMDAEDAKTDSNAEDHLHGLHRDLWMARNMILHCPRPSNTKTNADPSTSETYSHLPGSTAPSSLLLLVERMDKLPGVLNNRMDKNPNLHWIVQGADQSLELLDYAIEGGFKDRDEPALDRPYSQKTLDSVWEDASWGRCEATAEASRVVERRSCAKLKKGEGMMACSKCLGVRYCSKAHQKAHWKLHKQVCHEPKW